LEYQLKTLAGHNVGLAFKGMITTCLELAYFLDEEIDDGTERMEEAEIDFWIALERISAGSKAEVAYAFVDLSRVDGVRLTSAANTVASRFRHKGAASAAAARARGYLAYGSIAGYLVRSRKLRRSVVGQVNGAAP